jgi:predicted RNA polymerase sigma factor
MRLHLARAEARFTSVGELVLLRDQDRTRWDRSMIAEGIALIEQAAALGQPGLYQVEAAIIACHAEAQSWGATDWRQIVLLYDLLRMSPSPVVRLNRAVALRQVEGPEAALTEVEALAQGLEHHHLFHAIRGSCCWS